MVTSGGDSAPSSYSDPSTSSGNHDQYRTVDARDAHSRARGQLGPRHLPDAVADLRAARALLDRIDEDDFAANVLHATLVESRLFVFFGVSFPIIEVGEHRDH